MESDWLRGHSELVLTAVGDLGHDVFSRSAAFGDSSPATAAGVSEPSRNAARAAAIRRGRCPARPFRDGRETVLPSRVHHCKLCPSRWAGPFSPDRSSGCIPVMLSPLLRWSHCLPVPPSLSESEHPLGGGPHTLLGKSRSDPTVDDRAPSWSSRRRHHRAIPRSGRTGRPRPPQSLGDPLEGLDPRRRSLGRSGARGGGNRSSCADATPPSPGHGEDVIDVLHCRR